MGKMEVVMSYVIEDGRTINVYDIIYGRDRDNDDDAVVAGFSEDDVKECLIEYEGDDAYFHYNDDIRVYMGEAMREW